MASLASFTGEQGSTGRGHARYVPRLGVGPGGEGGGALRLSSSELAVSTSPAAAESGFFSLS